MICLSRNYRNKYLIAFTIAASSTVYKFYSIFILSVIENIIDSLFDVLLKVSRITFPISIIYLFSDELVAINIFKIQLAILRVFFLFVLIVAIIRFSHNIITYNWMIFILFIKIYW
jgi:hypothetical protein